MEQLSTVTFGYSDVYVFKTINGASNIQYNSQLCHEIRTCATKQTTGIDE
jgi:hypothetical protein